ncbi:efflux RND transporter periplasmic adaptor subunit [Rhodovulum adriaticum]|uniref:HlyD family secretion protein n=1 Tax=Rhodovulum adriaticum TaxID=35804 RepID=A0A4V2SL29_RHOAD|nr:HlyD family efflux transporter periplasmic adaptor subunit [Rhodovulum adriaticum]MBK1635570.1 efflux transporter periplasmic adaptor subunit [Rhodovulum adriaticum]TCP21796.1 HlyD family secretion protein [Rhodovulum adriaticum]
MRFLRRSLVGLFLIAVTVGILAYAGNTIYSSVQARLSQEPMQRPPRERIFAVNVLSYQPGQVTPVMTAFGEVRARRTLELRAQSGGEVIELHPDFEEGGIVRKGELVLRVDPADAQSALQVARTDLAEAQADLRDAERTLELAREELEATREQARLRERALARQQNLRDRGVGTDSAVEEAELVVASANQAVVSRRQSVAQAEAALETTRTGLERARINLAEAERDLADTELYAPLSGQFSDVSLTEGGLVSSNERVADLIDASALEVSFRLSTVQYSRLLDEAGKLRPAPVTVVLDVFGADLEATGTITRESAAVGEGQVGRVLYARLDGAAGFRPGDFVTVRIEEPPLDGVARLPASAINAAGELLVLGQDDRLEAVAVTLLRRQDDDVIVRGADLAGREVVAERSPLLGAGIKVRPIRPGADAGGGQPPDLVELSPERRAALIAFIDGNPMMPDAAKARVKAQLEQDRVPARMVERIESRMGG